MTRTCQFPEGDPLDPRYRACGRAVERPGSSYCDFHRGVAYRKDNRPHTPLRKSQPPASR
jgi:hypothetical protein